MKSAIYSTIKPKYRTEYRTEKKKKSLKKSQIRVSYWNGELYLHKTVIEIINHLKTFIANAERAILSSIFTLLGIKTNKILCSLIVATETSFYRKFCRI